MTFHIATLYFEIDFGSLMNLEGFLVVERIKSFLKPALSDLPYENVKLGFMASIFFFVIAAYSTLRSLKTSVFLSLIGVESQPYTKFISILLVMISMPAYSFLVDRLRRYQILYFFFVLYAFLALVFAYFFLDPVSGLSNTARSPWRAIGWCFYFFMEFFPVFIVSSFWAFSNSINTPDSAKKNYGFIVAASKVAGMLSPLLSLFILKHSGISEYKVIPFLIIFCGILLLIAAFLTTRLIATVPGHHLHGYEAVYQLEKEKGKRATGLLEGIRLMLTQPYVFSIFGLVYSYEIISAMGDYQMQVLMSMENGSAIGTMSSFMFLYTASFQGLGLFFALFGTASLLRYFDVQACLLSVPVIAAFLISLLFLAPSLTTIFLFMVILRAMHYGFNVPVREILYIPTTKDIKFKSKAWIDSFGRTISKTSGATVNLLSQSSPYSIISTTCGISLGIVALWGTISYFVSKKYMNSVAQGKAIGDNNE